MLLVGYIAPNTSSGTAEGIDATITIKAYLDKDKIGISDTYPSGDVSHTEGSNEIFDYTNDTTDEWANGRTVLTTQEWNTLQNIGVSFKVKVEANEGIWVVGSLEEIMKKTAVMDNINSLYVNNETPGIDFGAISSDINGKGVYTRAGTENDEYPIMYYRGDIDYNNVLFANKCWKTVRTTDTGGVKLIYNGLPNIVYDEIPLTQSQYDIQTNTDGTNTNVWTFDSTDNSWNVSTTSSLELSFKVPAGDGYIFEMTGQNGVAMGGNYYIYNGTELLSGGGGGSESLLEKNYSLGTLTADEVIKFSYSGSSFTTPTPTRLKVRMIKYGNLITMNGCDNLDVDSQMSLDGTYLFDFNIDDDLPAYNGYMYGETYINSRSDWESNVKFGSGFIWDGTNYKLIDASVTIPDANHHYSCNMVDENAPCNELRYVFYVSGNAKHYITLAGGDGIEEAIAKMQANTTNSNAKNKIDTWYASNLISYTNKLEDTIWCNDRSFGDGNNNGWIANGGDLSIELYYGAKERSAYASNTSTVKNQPSLACANKNDRFTVSNTNGNGDLTYPIALLTEDEIVFAGGLAGIVNGTFYLKSSQNNWSLSPKEFSGEIATIATQFLWNSTNYYVNEGTMHVDEGIRPSVSLKPGQLIKSGTGTVTDPYVIE